MPWVHGVHDVGRTRGRKWCSRPRFYLSRNWTVHTCGLVGGQVRLVAKKFWGVSAWSVTKGSASRLYWPSCETYMEMAKMKRRNATAESKPALHLAAVESDLLSKLMPLVQHCCHTQYEDGSVRKPGWITLKTMGSAWVVEVKDPDSCSRLTVVQQTLDEALQLTSLLLESDEAPWEQDPWLKAAEAKGKKK